MKNKYYVILMLSIAIASCKSPKFLTDNSAYTKLTLNVEPQNISIVDKRPTISPEEDIFLPFISSPGEIREFHPKLKPIYKEIISQTIRENTNSNSTNSAKITVLIMEARKEFSATFSYEQELVSFKIKLILELNGEKTEIEQNNVFYRKAMDAKYKRFERLFQKSLKEVTYNALKQLEEQD